MSIIGIHGRIGSGKDTLGNIMIELAKPGPFRHSYNDIREIHDSNEYNLISYPPWEIKKFAAKLKIMASMLTGIPVESFEDQELKKSKLGPEWDNMTVREFLQKMATEGLRDQLHPNVWVNGLMQEYLPVRQWPEYGTNESKNNIVVGFNKIYPNWIITDCRFLNEVVAIKERGGILVKITRPGKEIIDQHKGENELENVVFDYEVLNNSTMDALKEKALQIMAERRFM